MRWKTYVFYLWSLLCSTDGTSVYLPCQETTNQATLLHELKHCNLSVENGHLHARCHILVKFPLRNQSIPSEPDIMTMEQLLVSEDTVRTVSQACASTRLSLLRVEFKKWDVFPENLNSSYDHFEMVDRRYMGRFSLYSLLIEIRQLTFDVTLHKPPPVAVAVSDSKRVNQSDIFSIYGLADFYHLAFPDCCDIFRVYEFSELIQISNQYDAVITVTGIFEELPLTFFGILAFTPIMRVAIHSCSIRHVSNSAVPSIKSIRHLEFSQCPIESVDPWVFQHIPSVKNISLTSTKLPGIPEAIFSLKTLIYLNMSGTNVPPGLGFDFWPASRNVKSSAERLITSGSNVTLLRDRELCGFPNLTELHMDGCHLEILQGSPFVCLKKLQVLSLEANKIPALHEATLEGLTDLLLLNMNRNRLTVIDGTNVLIPLMSLQVLHISFNSIEAFRVDKPLNSSPEVLFAQHNRITKWKPPIFSRMTKMKMLNLSHNMIAVLDNEMFRDLNDIQNVSLSFNPWDCSSCYLNNLHNFLDNHQVQCAACVTCEIPEGKQGYHVRSVAWREEECVLPDYYPVYATAGIICIILAAVLVYGAYKYRWNFMYLHLYLKVGIKGNRRHVNAGNYAWDAFVSYHSSDSDWVHEVLLHKLESPPHKFHLCVAARDFIPGVLITDNILRAITHSRVCLFVLSPAFCRSRWCMIELSLAQQHFSDTEKSDGLVFIKKEQVRESEMSNLLLRLTRSRTYIRVPPLNATERRNNLFWMQLQAALQ
ncbi:hypothetical protein HPB48_016888 [Haemaphysalis longicornis]|uniref:TIR domain-containing protein n=1 Tax=Haemaphysalis longicornis TaxID=44386 RepID=A0A9J6GJS7_HAELO|nr:hypothetical protein HPB48_016888 [Haemaphysalis longicornis]